MAFALIGSMELRMSSPSIIPNGRLDRDIYLVLEDFNAGPAWCETDEADTDISTVVEDLLTGQYELPLRVVVFNPVEGWVRALLASRALLVKIKRDLENDVRGLLKNLGLVIGRAKFNIFAV
jgi:hypothetical protein